jgi:exodeoxyribonuclease VII large subunit
VSGVGHETDVTLADLAADLRAATPTAAAELVAPATAAQRQTLDGLAASLARRSAGALETQAQRLDRIAVRLARPSESLARRGHVLDLLAQRLAVAPARALAAGRSRSDAAAARLRHSLAIARSRIAARVNSAAVRIEALDPHKVLARGYALLVDRDERPVTSVSGLVVGATVSARLSDGRAELTTTAIEPANTERRQR